MDQHSIIKLKELQVLTYQVLHPDENSEYYFQDVWQTTHSKITLYCNELLPVNGENPEEEAHVCLTLLIAAGISPCLNEQKIQQILDRAFSVLPALTSLPLKKQLQKEVNHLTR